MKVIAILFISCCFYQTVVDTSSCDTSYFKKVVRRILGNLEERGDHEIVVTASKDDIATLEKFVKSDDGNAQDAYEVVIGIVSSFKGKGELYDFSQWDNSVLSYITKEAILILASLATCAAIIIILKIHTKYSWWKLVWGVLCLCFIVCFIVSIPWEWYYLYRKEVAKMQAEMEKTKDIPKECRADHALGILESLKLWFKKSFSFSDTPDPCAKYQEMHFVDPIWGISPLKAFWPTVTSMIIQPLEHIGEGMGKCFRAFFKEVPIQWQPFLFMAVFIIIIIAMFMISGLQVRSPFLTITPGNVQGNLQSWLQRLDNHIQQLQQYNNDVQQLNDDVQRFHQRIDHDQCCQLLKQVKQLHLLSARAQEVEASVDNCNERIHSLVAHSSP